MRVCITDLEAFEKGFVVSEWLDFPMSVDELNESIKNVFFEGQKACNDNYLHEEFFITDYEADMSIGEYDNIYLLNEIAEALEGFDEGELLKFRLLVSEGYKERDIIESGLDSYEVEIYDFRGKVLFNSVFELLAIEFFDEGVVWNNS